MTLQLMSDGIITPVSLVNSATGAAIDATAPAPVTSLGVVLSGSNGWSLASSGFSNPSYLAANVADSTGWDVSQVAETVITFEGTYTGPSITFEWTNDPTGATGWQNALVYNPTLSSGNLSAGAQTGTAVFTGGSLIIPARGQRMRGKATAVASGTMIARVETRSVAGPMQFVSAEVHGASAHGVAVAAAPVRAAGRARADGTPYTALSADQTADLVTDLLGNLHVMEDLNGTNYSTNQTGTVIKSGAGRLKRVTINAKGTVASVITLWNNTAASGTKLATIDSLNLSGTFDYDVAFSTGLTVSSTGTVAPDFTVVWR